jgi:diguanylate cyclase (GGDEF)-like protein
MHERVDRLRSRGEGLKRRRSELPDEIEAPAPMRLRPPPAERSDTLSAKRLERARAAHRGYFRWLRLTRLTQAAFVILAVLFLLWSLPWLPKGLDTADYTPELAFTIYLVVGVAAAAVLASAFQEFARRDRESLLLLGELFDETTGLHTRTYLNDRLVLECERAKRGGRVFSLLVLQFRATASPAGEAPALSAPALQEVGQLVDSRTHASDLVARLSGAELAVLATGVDRAGRMALVERLRRELEAVLPGLVVGSTNVAVKCGVATFGEDGVNPDALVHAARTDSILAVRRLGQAA